ncbi:hypothetical protein EZ054_13695 [Enterococcus faecalis]|uniref:hypothetical protein n=1 Tax=Enterococcus faecalis TaxID=1351 RepID=UPI0012E15C73|nr:hypothetical protein [Enterococcus faecalis]MUN83878.1 hypothetical protein [Enterococcus faecalis]
MIPLLFDLSEEELIKADIFSHVLESIGNSDCYQIKKIIVFCVELCNYILKVDSLTLDYESFKESELFEYYLRDTKFKEIIFTFILDKKAEWIFVKNIYLVVYCFVKMFLKTNRAIFYESLKGCEGTSLKNIPARPMSIADNKCREFEFSKIMKIKDCIIIEELLIMTEAVDTEIFGQEYLCPLIKNFEKEYKKETLDEYILNLFKETELTIEIETKTDVKGSVMSISSLMWVLEILENKCWFGDFIYELTEQQILSLLEKPYAKKK